MGATVKYLSVYETTIKAVDKKSGKAIVNVLHYRTNIETSSPPAYGAATAGPSDLDTFLTNLNTSWRDNVLPLLSVNYGAYSIAAKQITGWTTGSTASPVYGASNSTPIEINAGSGHNIRTGDQVVVSGALGNTAANGTFTVTRTGDAFFTLNGSVGNGTYTGGGSFVRLNTGIRLTYGDTAVLDDANTTSPGTGTEACPLFDSLSVRKITALAGRNWRGGIRFAPIAESSQENGRFTTAAQASNVAGMVDFLTDTLATGGTGLAGFMSQMLFSRNLAILSATPFTQSSSYSSLVTNLLPRINLGSVLKRKPKLTANIS